MVWARAAALGLAAAGMTLIGCALPKPPPERGQGAYSGPAVSVGERMGKHTAVFECPNPGWAAGFDQLRDDPEGWTAVFVTLRRPSPIFVYPQVVTRQEVLLDVSIQHPVRVFVRVLDHDSIADGAYHLGGEATGK